MIIYEKCSIPFDNTKIGSFIHRYLQKFAKNEVPTYICDYKQNYYQVNFQNIIE